MNSEDTSTGTKKPFGLSNKRKPVYSAVTCGICGRSLTMDETYNIGLVEETFDPNQTYIGCNNPKECDWNKILKE